MDIFKKMMSIEQVSHERILNEYGLSPESLFAFYVAYKLKNASTYCAVDENVLKGLLICGGDYGLFEAHQCWILAKDQETFDAILNYLIESKVHDSFMAAYGFVENSHFKNQLRSSKDFLYVLERDENISLSKSLPKDIKVLKVSNSNLSDFKISPEIKDKIGSFSDFVEGCNFWALIFQNEIIGICDALVCYSNFSSIQQVYVLSQYRGMGLSKLFLGSVVSELKKDFDLLTYIVSEENLPSIRLAESLGFKREFELADTVIKR